MYIDEDGNEYEMPKAEVCRRWLVLESQIQCLNHTLRDKELEQYNLIYNLMGDIVGADKRDEVREDINKIAKEKDITFFKFRRELLALLDERVEIFLKDFD